ncbi:MAG: chemotaxis protein CheV [Proteobacteria bacterium]|jgi:two-component system chemotaxis response regulator CheV|nr:chemotaxis protein CheV [Pseudomonadota bacterium]
MSSVMEGVDRLTRIAGQNRVELLLFQLGPAQTFGINVFKVREVLKCPQLRRVPQSNRHVCGVMHTRGRTVTVIDLASVLGMPPLAGREDEFVVITEYNGRVQGYLVAKVERIVNLRWDEINPPPRGIGETNYLTAVVTVDSRLIEILDVERVLAEIVGVDDTVSANLCEENTSAGRPHHVFVADDSMVARKQITKVLDQIGFTYDVAENGREAWDMLKAAAAEQPILSKYGMVISDIEMPEMDGYTLTKAIKSDSELKSLYVCLHTSLSGSFNQSMAESVGADRLVPKFVADDLAMVVREVVLGE